MMHLAGSTGSNGSSNNTTTRKQEAETTAFAAATNAAAAATTPTTTTKMTSPPRPRPTDTTTTTSILLPSIPSHFLQQQQQQQQQLLQQRRNAHVIDDDSEDLDDDDDALLFAPVMVVPANPSNNTDANLKTTRTTTSTKTSPNTTTNPGPVTTHDSYDSSFYADEASLYSIAEENSRNCCNEDDDDDEDEDVVSHARKVAVVPSSVPTVMITTNDGQPMSNVAGETATLILNSNNSTSTSNSSDSNSNNNNDINKHSKAPSMGHSSHSTLPRNNVTSYDDRKEYGMELSYGGYNTNSNGVDSLTKASDEYIYTYYHTKKGVALTTCCFPTRSKTTKRATTATTPKRRIPILSSYRNKSVVLLLLSLFIIGIVFLTASLIVYQSRKNNVSKSISSIESDATQTPTVAPAVIGGVPTAPSLVSVPPEPSQTSPSITINNTTAITDDMKYIMAENYVYTSIKACPYTTSPTTSTSVPLYFNASTIQGRVFDALVKEVIDSIVVKDSTIVKYASYHTTTYIRDKYVLMLLYLFTSSSTEQQQESGWYNNTNWMIPSTDICTWYGITCTTTGTNSTTATPVTTSFAFSSTTKSSTTSGNSGGSSSTPATCEATEKDQPYIIEIDLSNNQLRGRLPTEMCCLSCIQELRLRNNPKLMIDYDTNIECINDIPALHTIDIANTNVTITDDGSDSNNNGDDDNISSNSTTSTDHPGAGFNFNFR